MTKHFALLLLVFAPTTLHAQVTFERAFYCGVYDFQQEVVNPVIPPGATGTLSFFYTEPDFNVSALTLSVEFNGFLDLDVSTFSITGTIFEAVGTEYIYADVDLSIIDGDGCELVAELILDFEAPFDGQTVPATGSPLEIAHIETTVSPSAPFSSSLFVLFLDGLNGTGSTPFVNSIVVDGSQTMTGFETYACAIVTPPPEFTRGDVDGNGGVNSLVDALYLLNFGFQMGPVPPCLDGADFDDNGIVNPLVDGVGLLAFGYSGGPSPPPPFPFCGVDPTSDALTCAVITCP